MTREIKFRIFDRLTDKMNFNVELMKKDDWRWWVYDNWAIRKDTESSRRYVMQYTWLKDKNWVEIYEGDIVKVMENASLKVIYNKAYCAFTVGDDKIWYNSFLSNFTEIEIIWNIYETRELLK